MNQVVAVSPEPPQGASLPEGGDSNLVSPKNQRIVGGVIPNILFGSLNDLYEIPTAPHSQYSRIELKQAFYFQRTEPSPPFLTQPEILDVLESRGERARGETKRFTTPEELFEWLDSE